MTALAPALAMTRRAPVPWMALAAVIVSAAGLIAPGFIAWISIQAGWETIAALLFRPRVGELLLNTALLVIFAVPLCAMLGMALAWLTERSDLPGARIWSLLAAAPLAVPAFVHSYGWISVAPGLHGLWAGVLVAVLAYFPLMYLPLAATMRRLDPALEDAAASLGHAPWRVFRLTVLPQLRPALGGGSLLVALHLLAEYGLFVMIRFDTFTTAIVDQFQSSYNGPAANMLAGVLLACCLCLLALEACLRGGDRLARVGSGAARRHAPIKLGHWRPPSLAGFALVALLALGVPMLTLARWLAAGGADVWRASDLGPVLGQTLLLALGGGILTMFAALPMAWLSIRRPSRLQRLMEKCQYLAGAVPGVVVALALVTLTVRVALPLYQTVFTVLAAYALMFLPRALVSLRASIAQAPVELEQAAASLGHAPARALWRVTLRLAAPGAAAGTALAALGITTELTATLMLAPTGTQTLATSFWSLTNELDYAAAAPYALLMVLMSLPMTLLLHVQSRRMAGR